MVGNKHVTWPMRTPRSSFRSRHSSECASISRTFIRGGPPSHVNCLRTDKSKSSSLSCWDIAGPEKFLWGLCQARDWSCWNENNACKVATLPTSNVEVDYPNVNPTAEGTKWCSGIISVIFVWMGVCRLAISREQPAFGPSSASIISSALCLQLFPCTNLRLKLTVQQSKTMLPAIRFCLSGMWTIDCVLQAYRLVPHCGLLWGKFFTYLMSSRRA